MLGNNFLVTFNKKICLINYLFSSFSKFLTDESNINKSLNDEDNVKGSKYATDDFIDAKINPFGDRIFQVRYDAVEDQIEVLKSKGEVIVLDKTNSKIQIQTQDKTYILINQSYFIELFKSDKFNIFKKEYKKLNPKIAPRTSYDKGTAAHYDSKLSENFFIQFKDNIELIEFDKKTKSVIKLFPTYKNDIKTYEKNNSLNLKEGKDLVSLFKHLSEIIE